MFKAFWFSVIVSLYGCGFGFNSGAYRFSDTAVYTAPLSGLQVIVETKGHVEDGFDLGAGTGNAKLYALASASDTLYLKTSPENIDSIQYRGISKAFSCSPLEKGKLYTALDSMGFKNISREEIAEIRDAITYINYGHKAGFLKGQTKYIKVDTVIQQTIR